MKALIPIDLAEHSTMAGKTLAKKTDIPNKLPADGGDADTIGGKGPEDFAPMSHVGSGGNTHALATTTIAGFMSGPDKTKLNNIATEATKTSNSTTNGNIVINGIETTVYTHPSTHSATMITEDSSHRFVTDAQISAWNSKQSALGYTPENVANKGKVNGYASLDFIGVVPAAQLPTDVFVPISHVGSNGNAHALATTTVAGFMSGPDKTKLNNIATGATKTEQSATNGNVLVNGTQIVVYAHPSTHPATMITEDGTHRFVTDTQISTWNAKQNALGFTPENIANKGKTNGYASLDSSGKIPLTQLPDTAKQQTYIVLNNTEMNALTGLISGDKCFQTSTGDSYIYNGTSWILMADADWANVSLTWENISGKPSASPTNIDDAVVKRHTHSNKATLDAITSAFTTELKSKLDNIQANANNYIHPSLHPATMITEDTTHRFVTDTQISVWNAKQDALGYTPLNSANNLNDVASASSARSNLGLTGNSNTTHYHDGRYYTQTNLQTSGQASVHWGNITNTPTSMPADGGNADTVDSLHANQFLRKDVSDTMTGTLTVTGNIYIKGNQLGFANDANAIVVSDFNDETRNGYYSGADSFTFQMDGSTTNTLVKTGHLEAKNLYTEEKIGVNKFSMEYNETEGSIDFIFTS